MKTARRLGAAFLWLILLSSSMGQEKNTANPYPLITYFLGEHRAFSATLVSAVQSEDGMVMEGGRANYAYLDGETRKESAFSEQWMALFVMSEPDTNAIKQAGMDVTIEVCVPDRRKLYVIFPNAKAYCDMDLPPDVHPFKTDDLKVDRVADGTETIDGHHCLRSKITVVEKSAKAGGPEEKMEGMLWEAEDLKGFPIKVQVHFGGMFKSTEVFTDVKLTEPDRSLFVPPAGFKTYASVEDFSETVQRRLATDQQRGEDFWKAVEIGDIAQMESLSKQSPEVLQARRPDGQTPLHVAARAGQKEAIDWLIGQRMDIKAVDNKGLTALHEAAASGSRSVIESLLRAGAEVDAQDANGRTPLLAAAANGKKKAVDALLKGGADPNKHDNQEMTALHLAAGRGAKDVVALLLLNKAEPNAKNRRGLTPLWEAMIQGYEDVVVLLVTHGGDINAVGMDKRKPLRWAVKNNRLAMAYTLLTNHADPELRDNWASALLLPATRAVDADLVNFILDGSGDNISSRPGRCGETPLHLAASHGWAEVVRLLIARKADVNAGQYCGGGTPLDFAENEEVARLLIAANADVNADTVSGETALHLASGSGKEGVVKLLLAGKANVNAESISADTPLHYAAANGRDKIVRLLIAGGADANLRDREGKSAWDLAIDKEQEQVLAALLAVGPDLEAKSSRGMTALQIAAEKGWTELATTLLAQGAEACARSRSNLTAAWYAENAGHRELSDLLRSREEACAETGLRLETAMRDGSISELKTLIESESSLVNYRDGSGQSVLSQAVSTSQAAVVGLFLNHGAGRGLRVDEWAALLRLSVTRGDGGLVESLLSRGADANARDDYGRTPLFFAQTRESAEALVAHGADVNARDNAGWTPIFEANAQVAEVLVQHKAQLNYEGGGIPMPVILWAVFRGDTARVEFLLSHGVDPNGAVAERPLHLAVQRGQLEVVRVILAHKADVNAIDGNGKTALTIATEAGHKDLASFLITSGATGSSSCCQTNGGVERPDAKQLETALRSAAGNCNTQLVLQLLQQGARVTGYDFENNVDWQHRNCPGVIADLMRPYRLAQEQGDTGAVARTLLAYTPEGLRREESLYSLKQDLAAHPKSATAERLYRAVEANEPETVKVLLSYNADVNGFQAWGSWTALHKAANSPSISAMLLDHGANIAAVTIEGWTPLHCAARAGNKDVAAMLIDHNVDIAHRSKTGETALHFAAGSGNIELVKLLLANKADVTIRSNTGGIPIHAAAAEGDTNVIKLLQSAGADIRAVDNAGMTTLHLAAAGGHTDAVTLLLTLGVSVEATNRAGITPLHCASAGGYPDVVSVLLTAGANVHLADRKGDTPLHVAKNAEVAKLLLESGSDLNGTDANQRTPLLCAVAAHRKDVVGVLVARGAEVDASDDKGRTPLHEAVADGQMEIAEILVMGKADPNARAKDGKTPLHVASNRELADFLLSQGADINARTADGSTPSDTARQANRIDLATYIHQRSEMGESAPVK